MSIMKALTTLVVSLSIAACQSTPKVPRQPTQTAMEGGGNNSASGTMSGTPSTGGTDPRGAGDDAPSTQEPQPPQPTTTPTPEPLPQPIPPNPAPPPTDAGTSNGGAASGPNRGASSVPPR
jgi:hypothetical protein